MKRVWMTLVGVVLLTAGQAVWADDPGKTGIAAPAASSTPGLKAKGKKTKKKTAAKKAVQSVWVCPMGDYSGSKTADGKCPKCGMDLFEKK